MMPILALVAALCPPQSEVPRFMVEPVVEYQSPCHPDSSTFDDLVECMELQCLYGPTGASRLNGCMMLELLINSLYTSPYVSRADRARALSRIKIGRIE